MNHSDRSNAPCPAEATLVKLVCHPATPCSVSMEIAAQCTPYRSGEHRWLMLSYTLRGDVERVRLPQVCDSTPADGLWAHTCFEAFVAETDSTAYHEFNFSPSTQWAHYRFTDERARDPLWSVRSPPKLLAPEFGPAQMVLKAKVAAEPLGERQSLSWLGLTTVLELTDGSLSFWALHHPAASPDFHSRAGWTIPFNWSMA